MGYGTRPDLSSGKKINLDRIYHEIIKPADSEFVIYHIHIVSENETLEEIMKKYECTLEDLRMYNEITNINIGDKIIIPEKNE